MVDLGRSYASGVFLQQPDKFLKVFATIISILASRFSFPHDSQKRLPLNYSFGVSSCCGGSGGVPSTYHSPSNACHTVRLQSGMALLSAGVSLRVGKSSGKDGKYCIRYKNEACEYSRLLFDAMRNLITSMCINQHHDHQNRTQPLLQRN